MPDEQSPPEEGGGSSAPEQVPEAEAAAAQEADDLAAEALKAAQEAISQLGSTGMAQAAGEAPAPAAEPAAVGAVDAGRGRTIGADLPGTGGNPAPLDLPAFSGGEGTLTDDGIELLSDVELSVRVELGRTVMLVEDVLRLNGGAIVELDKLAGDPVDVYVNDRRVARGEVLVLNDTFCVRISEVVEQVSDDALS
jgi:flagellar motor switch protein FliN/FliY